MANPNFPNNPGYNLYIGARYVPVFSDVNNGIWDGNTAYEPLTIVTYQGDSYTSKTFVPAGINPTNTTYWANTGNYNAQIEQVKQDVENYNAQIEQVKQDVENYNAQIEQVKQDVENLSNSTTQSITNLDRSFNDKTLKHSKILCIGDSTNTATGWGSFWPELSGATITNWGFGGCGFTHKASSGAYQGKNFLSAIQSQIANVTPESYNYIMFVGGYNDFFTNTPYETVLSDTKNTFQYLKTNFPNAEIVFCPNSPRPNAGYSIFTGLKKLAIELQNEIISIPTMLLWGIGNESYFADEIHQNNYSKYSKTLLNTFIRKNYHFYMSNLPANTPINGLFWGGIIKIDNFFMTIDLYIYTPSKTPINIFESPQPITLFTLNNEMFSGLTNLTNFSPIIFQNNQTTVYGGFGVTGRGFSNKPIGVMDALPMRGNLSFILY